MRALLGVYGRASLVCVAAAALAPAQFIHLATTQDGSRVYFISSLRQTGTNQHLYTKIFSMDSAGVSLVLQPPPPGPDPFTQLTLDRLQAAADGSWLVYGQTRGCQGGSSCFLGEQHGSIMLSGADTGVTLGPNVRLSSDGRWEVVYSSPNVIGPMAGYVDRQTNSYTSLNSLPRVTATPSVARDGTAAIPTAAGLVLWRNGTATTVTAPVAGVVIDDAATTAVYQESASRLRVLDVATGVQWQLGATERANTAPQINANGRWVLYLSGMYNGPQIFFCARDGSGWAQLTDETGGIAEAVLSGDGRVAWAVSNNGALLRIDTFGHVVETRIEPAPVVASVTPGAAGSVAEITGANLARRTVAVGGRSAPVLWSEPSRMVIQAPWETPAGDTELKFESAGTYFEGVFPWSVAPVAPAAVRLGDCPAGFDCIPPVAYHEDWMSLVTENNPASAGELVHIIATGLGTVSPAVATGAMASANPFSRTTTYLEWTWPNESIGAEVLSSGLAPGLVGYYGLEVRLPPTIRSSVESLFVSWDTGQGYKTFQPFAYIPAIPSGQ